MASRSWISRLPLRLTVPLILVGPAVFVVAVLQAIWFAQGRIAARELTNVGLEQTHRRIAAYFDMLLSTPAKVNATNKSLVLEGRLSLDDLSTARKTLMTQLKAHRSISVVGLGVADGRATWAIQYQDDDSQTFYAISSDDDPHLMTEYQYREDGSLPDQPTNTYAYDARTRPWFSTPVESGEAAWSEPYLFVGGTGDVEPTLGISYSEPVHDSDGNLLGVIDAELTLAHISRLLERLKIAETGHVYIVNGRGHIIGTSTGATITDKEGHLRYAMVSEQMAVRDSARHLEQHFGSFSRLKAKHIDTINVDGKRTLVTATPYIHESGISWSIITLIPESDFVAHLSVAREQSMLLSLIVSVIVLLVGLIAGRLMVRPIEQLTEHVQHVGEGDLDRVIDLNQSPEMVRLSVQMNKMVAGLQDRMRIRRSLEVAMEVQQALLPRDYPQVEGLDISGHSTYCDETGGDYYDFLDLTDVDKQSMCVALGDVMGHGVAAAMLMATARGILRSRVREPGTLADLLEHMNQLLVHDTAGKRFMTMLLLTLDTRDGVLRWASAGHDMPICYDPQSDEFIEFDGGGLPLGIMLELDYEEYKYENLRRGQVYLMSTDGVWETQNSDGEHFGKERVQNLIVKHHAESAEQISKHIYEALAAFRNGGTQDDDITFVIVKVP